MKGLLVIIAFFAIINYSGTSSKSAVPTPVKDTTGNIFIITLDGFRWQEMFKGSDDDIISNPAYTKNKELLNALYGGENEEIKRSKLMPFIWNVVAKQGQVLGNRKFRNNVDVSNLYAISYPGYNEMFTGKPDLFITGNQKNNNKNETIFQYLSFIPRFNGKVAAYTSWNVFPFILNTSQSKIKINSGYNTGYPEIESDKKILLNHIEEDIDNKGDTRNDMLTFLSAKEFLQKNRPKVFYIAFGETDEYAHGRNYDMYLHKANECDKLIASIWQWIQSTDGYKNNTTLIITTDHGRGQSPNKWHSHNGFYAGSHQIWAAFLGKGIEPIGERKDQLQVYQRQIAQTIAHFAGERFGDEQPIITSLVSK